MVDCFGKDSSKGAFLHRFPKASGFKRGVKVGQRQRGSFAKAEFRQLELSAFCQRSSFSLEENKRKNSFGECIRLLRPQSAKGSHKTLSKRQCRLSARL
jgi:hypothetical protein